MTQRVLQGVVAIVVGVIVGSFVLLAAGAVGGLIAARWPSPSKQRTTRRRG